MYCSKCGTKLDDGDMFCPECGTKIVRINGSVACDYDNIDKAVDWQKMQGKTSAVLSCLRNIDKKKCVLGIVISVLFIILFCNMIAHTFNKSKEVKAKITWAGDIYTNDVGGNIWERAYYQRIRAVYGGKEWTGDVRVLSYYKGCSVGDYVKLYLVDGKLTSDRDEAKVDTKSVVLYVVLLLGSIGLCIWFALQFFKCKKRC